MSIWGFNGATLSRTWKQRRYVSTGSSQPRLQWSHAQPNVETRSNEEDGQIGCPLLQWSHAQPNVETRWPRAPRPSMRSLQWSHAQPNVETRDHRRVETSIRCASMEPRSAERGNFILLSCPPSPAEGFNGATLSRTWKPGTVTKVSIVVISASMEPRSAERGN